MCVEHKAPEQEYSTRQGPRDIKKVSLQRNGYRGRLSAGLPSPPRRFWVQFSVNYCVQLQKGKSFVWRSLASPPASWPSFNLLRHLLGKQGKKKTLRQSNYPCLSERAALKSSWKGRELQTASAQSYVILHRASLGLLVSNTSSFGEVTGPRQQRAMASARTVVASREQDELRAVCLSSAYDQLRKEE